MPVLAIGGVGLVVLIIALAALLMLMAGHIIHGITKGIFDFIPGIGGALSAGVSAFLGTVTKAAAPLYDRLVHPVAHWFWAYAMGPWHLAWNMVRSIADAKQWAVNAQQQAQAAQAAGTAAAATAQANAIAIANQNLGTAEQYADGAAAGAERYADQVGANAVTASRGLFDQAIGYTNTKYNDAVGVANTLHVADIGYANQVADDVRSEAVRLFGTAQGEITTLQDQVAGIPAEIAGTIQGVVPGLIGSALTGANVAAIPGIVAAVQALEAEATTCVEPLCDTVTPNAKQLGQLGSELKNLEGLFAVGALAALLVAAVEDPKGTANAIVDVTGWIPTLTVDLVDSVASAAGVVL